MTDLAAWLLDQIAEDERVADRTRRVHSAPGAPVNWEVFCDRYSPDARELQMRWNPYRVLAECDTKRRIVALHTPEEGDLDCPTCTDRDYRMPRGSGDKQWCDTLQLLAQPYADRVDYPLHWRTRVD